MALCAICDVKKAYYGVRGGSATHCSVCNKEQQLGLVNVSSKLCEFKLSDETLCPKQAKATVDGQRLCGQHAGGKDADRATCVHEGCTKARVIQQYCRVHARENGIKCRDDCVDCEIPKRGTYKIGSSYFCNECYEKRNPNTEKQPANINRACEGVDGAVCTRRPTFAPSLDETARRCKKCSEGLGWVSINLKYAKPKESKAKQSKKDPRVYQECIAEGCTRIRAYGYQSDGKRKVCSEHIDTLEQRDEPIVLLIKASKCECGKRALYGITEATHCSHCKTEEMSLLMNACVRDECNNRPSFGTGKRPTHCVAHKADDMVDLVHKQCAAEGCASRSSFGSDKTPTHCFKHKSDDMIDLAHSTGYCEVNDCKVRATFDVEQKKATRCQVHKADAMIDLAHIKCASEGCLKHSCFGVEKRKPTHCKTHMLEGMFDVRSKLCEYDGCNVVASFETTAATRCMTHKSDLMKNLRLTLCELCKMATVNLKYKPNCTQCHFYLHPEDRRITNYKAKEQAFMVPLKELFPNMILDKTIDGGCSRRRSNGFIECLTHLVIVEIDEDQHVGYDPTCENRRIVELYLDAASRPIVFVRLNPDGYRRDGKKINSVFLKTNTGGLRLNKREFERRFEELKERSTALSTQFQKRQSL